MIENDARLQELMVKYGITDVLKRSHCIGLEETVQDCGKIFRGRPKWSVMYLQKLSHRIQKLAQTASLQTGLRKIS